MQHLKGLPSVIRLAVDLLFFFNTGIILFYVNKHKWLKIIGSNSNESAQKIYVCDKLEDSLGMTKMSAVR